MRGAGAQALLPSLPPQWPPPLPLKVLQNLGPAFGCIERHVTGIIIWARGGGGRDGLPHLQGGGASQELSPLALPEVGGSSGG